MRESTSHGGDGKNRRRLGATFVGAAVIVAAAVTAVTLPIAAPAFAADVPARPATTSATQPGGPVVGATRIDLTFRVSSKSGQLRDTDAIRLTGNPPEGVKAEKDGSYILTADDVANHVLELGVVDGAYVAPEQAKNKVKVRLKDLTYPARAPYHSSAITSIRGQVTRFLNDMGVVAVLTQVDPTQVKEVVPPDTTDPLQIAYEDVREGDRGPLRLIAQLGVVTSVRTVAYGDRIAAEHRINSPKHENIRTGSPVQAAEASDQKERSDVVRKDLLDEYVYRLNRHPGRRVDVAVSQGDVPGGIALDYLVTESKPWTVYAQGSNTGTKQTSEWRERFGLIHNQLTGHDDILSLDFITAGFDDTSQAIVGSYELPIPHLDRLRARFYGSYSEYTASDVGQLGANDFTGEQATGGAELIANVWQHNDWFGDLIAGAKYEHVHTNNVTLSGVPGLEGEGEADVFLPYVGGRIERVTEVSSFSVTATATYGTADSDDLQALGRINPDDQWVTIEAGANYSFYLEPLLFPKRFNTPRDQRSSDLTLANELALSLRGQTALGYRLIPQHEEIAGGLYSVRGYPESAVAGDDVLIGSVEYRFHLPRALNMQPTPKTLFGNAFRVAPDRELGRPDWDLIFKGFVDAARSMNNDREPGAEHDETLVGTGLGIELQLKQNINLQAYWGVALADVEEADVEVGDNRFHFVFTILY